jgi:hypothetical protein
VLPGQATAPNVAAPTQIAVVDTVGSDRQNLLSISPLPAPPGVAIPPAEARGRFAISPEPNLAASGAPGVKTDELPKPAVGVGKKADNTGTAPSGSGGGSLKGTADKGNGSGTAGTKAGTGSSKDGASANTPAKNPFGGITVQGGRVEGTGMVSAVPPSKSTLTLGPSAPAAGSTAYGMTVVANAGTGGGLPDLGVFAHEQVYTVYLDMKTKAGTPAPSWTLQYALIPASSNEAGVLPPFPITKAPPAFPSEFVQKYVRRMVIVFAIIDAKGKLQQVVVKDTPNEDLNPFVLAALSKWTFRPAEANGKAAPVKVLLGIPLAQE